jgi:hypothetical protein
VVFYFGWFNWAGVFLVGLALVVGFLWLTFACVLLCCLYLLELTILLLLYHLELAVRGLLACVSVTFFSSCVLPARYAGVALHHRGALPCLFGYLRV